MCVCECSLAKSQIKHMLPQYKIRDIIYIVIIMVFDAVINININQYKLQKRSIYIPYFNVLLNKGYSRIRNVFQQPATTVDLLS